MANKQQYSIKEVKDAIAGTGGSIKLITERLNCSRSTVYRYIRKFPEIKAAYEAEDASVEDRPQYPKEKFEKAIEASNGIISTVAKKAGVSRSAVNNAINRWPELGELLKHAREGLVDEAEGVIVTTLRSQDEKLKFQAGKYVTATLGKKRGWDTQTRLAGPDGEALFAIPQDVQAALMQLNVDVDIMVNQFFDMIRAKAHQLEAANG